MTTDTRTATTDVPLGGPQGTPAPDAASALRDAPGAGTAPPPLQAGVRQLVRLRSIAIVGQAAAVAIALQQGVVLDVVPMAAVIVALIAVNAYAVARLKRAAPASHGEVALHLAVDLAAFSALLLLAGGAANPFALLYLLHVVLIAMLLPWRLALAGTLLVIANCALAFLLAEPLRLADGSPLPDGLATAGWGVSFALTAGVTGWFVASIVAALREHERLLREAARRALNDEAVVRIGTLAAGAAHELGTPLTTMAVIVGEMQREADTPARQRDAKLLAAQIDACRLALANLRAAAGHARAGGGGPERLDRFLEAIVAQFRATRPEVALATHWEGAEGAPEILADPSLRQAVLVLLNNAADASPQHVDVTARWNGESLRLTVGDRGGGVPDNMLGQLGRAFFTTKAPGRGTGLGLVLTASTVGRLGGTVRWSNRADGGLAAEIHLPLTGLILAPPLR